MSKYGHRFHDDSPTGRMLPSPFTTLASSTVVARRLVVVVGGVPVVVLSLLRASDDVEVGVGVDFVGEIRVDVIGDNIVFFDIVDGIVFYVTVRRKRD